MDEDCLLRPLTAETAEAADWQEDEERPVFDSDWFFDSGSSGVDSEFNLPEDEGGLRADQQRWR